LQCDALGLALALPLVRGDGLGEFCFFLGHGVVLKKPAGAGWVWG
jgi:hypothetical protein